ncbi:hypothetical protein [Deinococcus enclensis]|uniref:Uncharacterized protein n=1 Tax=Deinococcus enclensis TaxID=1049582 RepID=A0ABT9MI45_9DEIO|nr:hypothetical protein [Deinococcus enclensis]MDP9766136.1 hypothetical protein [Deinococcus enclensis]
MRFQTMYVDMRPLFLKWAGMVFVVLFLWWFYASIEGDFARALREMKVMYLQRSRAGETFDFGFWDYCLRDTACVKRLIPEWRAPLLVRAGILGGTVFSLGCALFGLLWRPEVVALRDTRVNAARIEESRKISPVPPRREL